MSLFVREALEFSFPLKLRKLEAKTHCAMNATRSSIGLIAVLITSTIREEIDLWLSLPIDDIASSMSVGRDAKDDKRTSVIERNWKIPFRGFSSIPQNEQPRWTEEKLNADAGSGMMSLSVFLELQQKNQMETTFFSRSNLSSEWKLNIFKTFRFVSARDCTCVGYIMYGKIHTSHIQRVIVSNRRLCSVMMTERLTQSLGKRPRWSPKAEIKDEECFPDTRQYIRRGSGAGIIFLLLWLPSLMFCAVTNAGAFSIACCARFNLYVKVFYLERRWKSEKEVKSSRFQLRLGDRFKRRIN